MNEVSRRGRVNGPPAPMNSMGCLNSVSDQVALYWWYGFACVSGYVLAEVLIRLGVQFEFLKAMHALSGVALYDVPAERKGELSIHLMAQTLMAPAYAYLNHLSRRRASLDSEPISIKAALAGAFMFSLMIWFTYVPIDPPSNPRGRKIKVIQFLVDQSNFSYAAVTALNVLCIVIGVQIMLIKVFQWCQFARGFRKRKVQYRNDNE